MQSPPGMWHVTLMVGGETHPIDEVLAALQRLADERPFFLSGRYDGEHAELQYWEEAVECADACALALRLWTEHRQSAGLPAWTVLGLAVLTRDEHLRREPPGVVGAGGWQRF